MSFCFFFIRGIFEAMNESAFNRLRKKTEGREKEIAKGRKKYIEKNK
jgi:hypothetical protein